MIKFDFNIFASKCLPNDAANIKRDMNFFYFKMFDDTAEAISAGIEKVCAFKSFGKHLFHAFERGNREKNFKNFLLVYFCMTAPD